MEPVDSVMPGMDHRDNLQAGLKSNYATKPSSPHLMLLKRFRSLELPLGTRTALNYGETNFAECG
jgi:hypothetical protein